MHNSAKQNEIRGRKAFSELLYNYSPEVKVNFTEDRWCNYDAYWTALNDNGVKKHYIVEIKIRNKNYDSYILEHKKVVGMRKEATKDLGVKLEDCVFLYVNFTPHWTYMWNITNVERTCDSTISRINKCTSKSRSNKVEKDVYFLPVTRAKEYNYRIKN